MSEREDIVVAGGLAEDRARTAARERIAAVLGGRWWPLVLGAAAVVVSLSAIEAEPINDELIHRAALLHSPQITERLSQAGLVPPGSDGLRSVLSDLFIAVQPGKNLESLKTYGALPWWTSDEYRVSFWRPVGSFTHWLDYRLFPESFTLMHLHSILWYAAAVFAVAVLYRRLIGAGWVAGLAGLLYVLDDAGYFPAMWVPNRNLLLALFFGILSILLHDRWRRQGMADARSHFRDDQRKMRHSVPAFAGALICLLASLLSAEAGVATFAYLFAYELALAAGPRLKRALALVPALAVIVGWRMLYNVQGYGTAGGGFYFDPGREPVGYVLATLGRLPFLLGGQWTTVPPDLYGFLPPDSRTIVWLVLAGVTILIPLLSLPMLRASPRARFWLIGMYAAALPFCATIPMSRSLLFVAIGGFGLIAEILAGWIRRERWTLAFGRVRGLVGALTLLLAVAHLPWAAVARASAAQVTATLEERVARTLALPSADCRPEQDLVIVNAPNPLSFLYDPYRSVCFGEPLPRGIRMLAPGYDAVRLARTGPSRVVLKARSDSLLDCQPGNRMDFVYFYRHLSDVRGIHYPFHVGWQIALPRMDVEVLAVDDRGFPVEAAFEFDVPLEDASLRWLCWDWEEERYEPLMVPPVGASIELVGPF